MHRNDETRFFCVLAELEHDPHVLLLKKHRQHKGNTTFRHCRSVAVESFRLAQRFGWKVDESALARGAMLHDYHLYTRRRQEINALRHLLSHPKRARGNAEKVFDLSRKEKNIIESHMWPLTFFKPPKSKEAFLVTLADKLCALREMRGRRT